MSALNRQANMGQAAAEGDVKNSFLGLKTKISIEKTVAMLEKVRDHAPKSATAAKAQFTIGEAYQAKRKYKEAIAAFRKLVNDQPRSSLAPEALFRVGQIQMEDADRGNQNQANLDLAREDSTTTSSSIPVIRAIRRPARRSPISIAAISKSPSTSPNSI